MERPVDPFHIVHDRKGFAYQWVFLQCSLKTLDFGATWRGPSWHSHWGFERQGKL
jgi:hypothetical protein